MTERNTVSDDSQSEKGGVKCNFYFFFFVTLLGGGGGVWLCILSFLNEIG